MKNHQTSKADFISLCDLRKFKSQSYMHRCNHSSKFPLHYDTITATERIHVVWWGCSHQVLLQAIQICLKLAKCCACICRQLQRKQNQYQTFNSKVALIVKFCQNITFSQTSNMHYNTPAPLYNCAKLQGSHLLIILGVSKMTYWLATIQSMGEGKKYINNLFGHLSDIIYMLLCQYVLGCSSHIFMAVKRQKYIQLSTATGRNCPGWTLLKWNELYSQISQRASSNITWIHTSCFLLTPPPSPNDHKFIVKPQSTDSMHAL